MKYLKSCLLKGSLLDTIILLMSILSIEIGLLCGWISIIQFQCYQT